MTITVNRLRIAAIVTSLLYVPACMLGIATIWAIVFSFVVAFLFRYHLRIINQEISDWAEDAHKYPFRRRYLYASLECIVPVLIAYLSYAVFFVAFPHFWEIRKVGVDANLMLNIKLITLADVLPAYQDFASFLFLFSLVMAYLQFVILTLFCLMLLVITLKKVLLPFAKVCEQLRVPDIPLVGKLILLCHLFCVFCCLVIPPQLIEQSYINGKNYSVLLTVLFMPYLTLFFTAVWIFRLFKPISPEK